MRRKEQKSSLFADDMIAQLKKSKETNQNNYLNKMTI